MISGFENDTATFYTEEETGTTTDPYGEETSTNEWTVTYIDVPVQSEQADAEYVRDVYGEEPQDVYIVRIDPLEVGEETEGGYDLGIEVDDRVELGVTEGTFSLQPPNQLRLDSNIPDYIEVEVIRVAD